MQQRAKRQRAAATSSLADLHTKELAMTMGDELGPKKGPRKGAHEGLQSAVFRDSEEKRRVGPCINLRPPGLIITSKNCSNSW